MRRQNRLGCCWRAIGFPLPAVGVSGSVVSTEKERNPMLIVPSALVGVFQLWHGRRIFEWGTVSLSLRFFCLGNSDLCRDLFQEKVRLSLCRTGTASIGVPDLLRWRLSRSAATRSCWARAFVLTYWLEKRSISLAGTNLDPLN
jgi:hypothetical protein